jgi:hypothetical protein
MRGCVIFLRETSPPRCGNVADKKMERAANSKATLNHAFISPVKPGFIGDFYWQIPI